MNILQHILLATTAIMISHVAVADGHPQPYSHKKVSTQQAENSTFNGLYVGGHIGGSRVDHVKPSQAANLGSFKAQGGYTDEQKVGLYGGISIGYNHMVTPKIVIGGGFDFNLENTKYKNSYTETAANKPIGEVRRKYVANLLGQLGYLVNPKVMPFFLLGVSYSQFKVTNGDNGGSISKTQGKFGPTVGAGFAYALNARLSTDLRYHYTYLGLLTAASTPGARKYTSYSPKGYQALTLGIKVAV